MSVERRPRSPRKSPHPRGPGFILRQAYNTLMAELGPRLVAEGVSLKHYLYLQALFEEDGLSHSVLAERVGVDCTTVTSVVDTMEARKLVKRIRATDDRRKTHVFLTPKGEQLREPLRKIVEEWNEAALHGLTPEQFARWRGELEQIVRNIQLYAPRPDLARTS
jgi:DNA-binding MarR family transcriptional regulator